VYEQCCRAFARINQADISKLAEDILFGQLRLVVATMDIEEINSNRDKFLEAVSSNVEAELKKIGLKLINVNVTDLNDESGYIIALGKEAAAKAINDAKKSVAEKNRDGEIGQAEAEKEPMIKVADALAYAKFVKLRQCVKNVLRLPKLMQRPLRERTLRKSQLQILLQHEKSERQLQIRKNVLKCLKLTLLR
jgi:uncharacterized membrane protein YqiK